MHHRTLRLIIALALLIVVVSIAFVAAPGRAQTSSVHLTMGNPSGAVADASQPTNYLIVRDQYAVGYHRDRGIPTWVSWRLAATDLGDTPRYEGQFIPDQSLPDGWYRVRHADYTNSGYDRGHMVPSADRTTSEVNNEATFILTNVVPQAPANNQGPWAQLEALSRDLARIDNELYIISGGHGSLGTLAGGQLTIPAVTWKALLILPAAEGDDAARVDAETQVIAIWMPNDASVAGTFWEDYQVSVACIEQRTGLDLFAAVADEVEAAIEGAPCDPVTPTPTTDPSVSPTPTTDPSASPTPTEEPGAEPTWLYLPLIRAVLVALPTPTAIPTWTPAPPLPTASPTATFTATPTATATSTASPTATTSPTMTTSPTATPTLPPPSFVSCGTPPANPGSAPNYPVRITAIDKVAETVTLQNTSAATVDLTDWRMCSITGGQTHGPISGVLTPGEVRVFPHSGGPIWNNASSDPGALYDAEGRLISYWPD